MLRPYLIQHEGNNKLGRQQIKQRIILVTQTWIRKLFLFLDGSDGSLTFKPIVFKCRRLLLDSDSWIPNKTWWLTTGGMSDVTRPFLSLQKAKLMGCVVSITAYKPNIFPSLIRYDILIRDILLYPITWRLCHRRALCLPHFVGTLDQISESGLS